MKISIINVGFSTPDFVLPQYNLLKKFMEEDFTYRIYDNSSDQNISKSYKDAAMSADVEYVRIPEEIHTHRNDVCMSCGLSCDWAIKHTVDTDKPDYFFLIDSDMFPIENFSLISLVGDNDVVGLETAIPFPSDPLLVGEPEYLRYFTNQLFFVKMKNLSGFENIKKFPPMNNDLGKIKGYPNGDCGSWMYPYFKKNSHLKTKALECFAHSNSVGRVDDPTTKSLHTFGYSKPLFDYFDEEIKAFEDLSCDTPKGCWDRPNKSFTEIVCNKTFLHFRAGTNWIGHTPELVQRRLVNLQNLIKKLLETR